MSHKVIDLASDDEKAKPIDLANSSDDDVEEIDDDDLQFACPRCTLLCARDVDVCVACTYEFRPPAPPPWPRARWPGFKTRQPCTSRANGCRRLGVISTSGWRGRAHLACCRKSTGASATVDDMAGGGNNG